MMEVHNCVWVRRQKFHASGNESFSRNGSRAVRHSTNIPNCRRLSKAAPNRVWIFVIDALKVPTNDTLHVLLLLRP
jgi:hypothetical protein